MKELLAFLIVFMVSVSAFAQGGPGVCQDCVACTGSYLVCDSNHDAFWSDVASNCGPGTSIEVEFLEGC